MKDWFYNELNHVGVDYSQQEAAEVYDEQMESFRDYSIEAKEFIDKLGSESPSDLSVVDLGCGTGAFSVYAAQYLKKVHAVDVSQEMMGIAQSKAEAAGIGNIEFHHAGFLQFRPDEQVDVVFSKWALHHLPDFWKQAALLNINRMLRVGGIFLLTDVVFKFSPDLEGSTEDLLQKLSKDFSGEFVEETKLHIKEEFSTFDWILQGLMERAGFSIEKVDGVDPLATEYLCRKTQDL